MKKLLFLLLVCLLLVIPATATITDYNYKQVFSPNVTGLTNYPIKVDVYNGTGTSSGTAIYLQGHSLQWLVNSSIRNTSNFADIRFADPSDNLLPFWIENTSANTTHVVFWVNVSDTSQNVTVYYGNATVYPASNGYATFPVYDHFDEASLNTTTWTNQNGTITQSASLATVTVGTNSGVYWGGIKSNTVFGVNYSLYFNGSYEAVANSYPTFSFSTLPSSNPATNVTNLYRSGVLSNLAHGANNGGGYGETNTGNYVTTALNGEIIRNGTTSTFAKVNGTIAATRTTSIPTASLSACVEGYGGSGTINHIYADWVVVRPWIYPDVSPTSWQNETGATPPVASFSNTSSSTNPSGVQFNDTSTNLPSTWAWQWGDGTANGTTQNPSHIYASSGTYIVNFTATNAVGSGTTSKNITVGKINWSGTPTSGAAPLTVQFNDSSWSPTLTAMSTWNWTFGDGQFSTNRNVTHVYTSAGTYNVTLNVTWSGGSNSTTQTNYITASAVAPAANFYGDQTWGSAPLTVNFYDISTGGTATSWAWQWGDGEANGTTQNPSHVYSSNGNYTVNMTATNAVGNTTKQRVGYILVGTTGGGGGGTLEAIFRSNVTSGTYPLNVQFTDLSTGGPETWNWSFGDGDPNSTETSPAHTYDAAGSYTVILTVTNSTATPSSATTSVSAFIVVANTGAPQANFYADSTWGINFVNASFFDISSGGNATSWEWDFGDGSSNSTDQNPVHNYTAIGTYNVTLNATNAEGSTVKTRTNYIQVSDGKPEVSFYGAPTNGTYPLTVSFHDTSGNTPTSWQWDFGDSTANATTQNPSHQYDTAGTYDVTLTATNAYGSNSHKTTAYIGATSPPAPVASFYGSPTSGTVSFDVTFHDTSTNTPTSWQWDFGDSTANATTQNPVHSYTVAGTYTVTMTAFNAYGNSTYQFPDMITGIAASGSAPTANFTASPRTGSAPQLVTFTDTSLGEERTAYYWDFGDGYTSTSSAPTHTYLNNGLYTVKFRATGVDGSDWENKTNWINLTAAAATGVPVCGFTSNVTGGSTYPCSVQFYQQCTGGPTSYNWSFGDGNYSTDANPNHTYTSQGYFTVYMNATNSYGTGEIQRSSYIHITQHYTRATATGTITPISTRGYNAILESIGGNTTPANATAAKVNFTQMLLGTTYPYTDVMGSLVLVIIFAIPFVLMWLMQRDLTLPGVVGIIVGAFLFIYIPSEWHLAPIAFIGMSIAAIIYGIMTRRE